MKQNHFSASLLCSQESFPLWTLVEGADNTFFDCDLVEQAGIPTEALPSHKNMNALDGKLLAKVTYQTVPIASYN